MRAIHGRQIAEPQAAEFGCSGRFASFCLEQDVWNTSLAQYGIDLWITSEALSRELERAVLARLENELQPALAALGDALRAALREAVAGAIARELQARKLDAGALAQKRSAPSGG